MRTPGTAAAKPSAERGMNAFNGPFLQREVFR